MTGIDVEEVAGRAAFRRFVELPWFLFRDEPRWSPPLAAVERARFERSGNPRLSDADYTLLLARRAGTPAGRLAVAVDDDGATLDGFESVDDGEVVAALVAAARAWLADVDVANAIGPDVLTRGFDAPGVTGRQWNPAWYPTHLTAAGLQPGDRRATWRIDATAGPDVPDPAGGRPPSTIAGRFVDPRLVLPGIIAVPDLRGSTVELARRARRVSWETAVVVAVDGDPAVLVPQVIAAAAAAGYRDVVAPWSPDATAAPETEHTTFTLDV